MNVLSHRLNQTPSVSSAVHWRECRPQCLRLSTTKMVDSLVLVAHQLEVFDFIDCLEQPVLQPSSTTHPTPPNTPNTSLSPVLLEVFTAHCGNCWVFSLQRSIRSLFQCCANKTVCHSSCHMSGSLLPWLRPTTGRARLSLRQTNHSTPLDLISSPLCSFSLGPLDVAWQQKPNSRP